MQRKRRGFLVSLHSQALARHDLVVLKTSYLPLLANIRAKDIRGRGRPSHILYERTATFYWLNNLLHSNWLKNSVKTANVYERYGEHLTVVQYIIV